jgi:hypothetical protein
MHKSAMKCNEIVGKWCKNKHRASKIIDTLETYQQLSKVPNVFHASQLQKCMKTLEETLSYKDVELQEDLTYVAEPSKILAENWKQLRNRAIKYCKVQWKHHPEREATWEKEEDLRTTYPEFFRYTLPQTSRRSFC